MATTTEIVVPKPEPRQADILLAKERFKVLCCGRRWGKGVVAKHQAMFGYDGTRRHYRGALDGGDILWAAPSYPEIERSRVWEDLKIMLKPVVRPGGKSEVHRRLDLIGDGSITVASMIDYDAQRGGALDGVVLDEAAQFKEDAWKLVLRPMLAERKGWGMFTTTPRGMNWFHRIYERAKTRRGWRAWQRPTEENPRVDKAELEELREELGEIGFSQEHDAKFVSAGAGMFKREAFRYYDVLDSTYRLEGSSSLFATMTRFATVDLAASTKEAADYRVIASWGLTSDRRLVLLDVVRARMEAPQIIPAIKRALERWRLDVVWIESNGYQLSAIQYAIEDGLPARELKADRDKVARAWPATAWLEAGRIWLPRVAAWLDAYETELCSFPEGEHDDQVDVTSYAVAVASGLHQRVSLLGVAKPSSGPSPVNPLDDEPEDDPRRASTPRRPARFGPRRPR